MKSSLKDDIREIREMNKMGLETFSFDKHNVLDFPIDKLIKNLKAGIDKSHFEYEKWSKLEKENPKKFDELDELAQRTGHSLQIQMINYLEEIMYAEDELFALFEIKIIYAFKHLEINIKKLLSSAYEDKAINRRLNWDNLSQYLSTKNINLKLVDNYEEINQLRLVNNSIKHSEKIIDESLRNITEFKENDNFSYLELEIFYKRIKDCPNKFLASLISAVYADIYEFNDKRISIIARSLALRMDKENAIKLSEYLVELYK